MKKVLSLTLAAVMLLSLVPTAFAAENNWQGGTKVEYTAATSEQYTVTVPATLAPGAAGDVVASGTWGSNRKLTVTADKDVTLTNSINAADTKTLDVTFPGIALKGSNTAAVTDTKAVSVAGIDNALFGTWSGTFYYDVEMVDMEPVAYLYNGERRPALPTSPEQYLQYIVMYEVSNNSYGNIAACSVQPTVSANGEINTNGEWFTYEDCGDGFWEGNGVMSYDKISLLDIGETGRVIWTNFDLYNEDGTLYMAASDPVPVYE